jgi:hypothetical protein
MELAKYTLTLEHPYREMRSWLAPGDAPGVCFDDSRKYFKYGDYYPQGTLLHITVSSRRSPGSFLVDSYGRNNLTTLEMIKISDVNDYKHTKPLDVYTWVATSLQELRWRHPRKKFYVTGVVETFPCR